MDELPTLTSCLISWMREKLPNWQPRHKNENKDVLEIIDDAKNGDFPESPGFVYIKPDGVVRIQLATNTTCCLCARRGVFIDMSPADPDFFNRLEAHMHYIEERFIDRSGSCPCQVLKGEASGIV